jgi:hypothetical protein
MNALPELGGTYRTQDGQLVKMVGIANPGTHLETLVDEHGVHRYSRQIDDAGRVTGTAHDYSHPFNLARPIQHTHLELAKIVTLPLETAKIVRQVCLPHNPNKCRGWHPDALGAVRAFIAALASVDG